MHTASYEFSMKPKESAGCHQTLSARVGSGDETIPQRRLDTLTDLYGTPCHVWLVNIARSTWRRLLKCVFVLALSRALDPVGAPYSVRG